MAKTKTKFVCKECGHESAKWLGKCPGCDGWNTFAEEIERKETNNGNNFGQSSGIAKPMTLDEIDTEKLPRIPTGISEFDTVLGGGIVQGALMLLGGEPGIGKSTIMAQVAGNISKTDKVLYVSGEESGAQIKMRVERLGVKGNNFLILAETDLDNILKTADFEKPKLLVVDSIQTMFCSDIQSSPGSVSQVREATGRLMRFAKEKNISILLIGHVTKSGDVAGPRMLEHMVDVVLYFEGERTFSFRILRAIKNRFGATNESGLFSMEETGLEEVKNPSALLLEERPQHTAGSVVLSYLEGLRPLMIEVQALSSKTVYGMPRRTANGFDLNRLNLIIAVLEKRVGIPLSNQDVYINTIGGIKINEPAADLAVALAIVSSFRDVSISSKTVVAGEIGLTGELRTVPHIETRIKETANLGFEKIIVPKGALTKLKKKPNIEVVGSANLIEAINAVFDK